MSSWSYAAFGLRVVVDFALPGAVEHGSEDPADVRVRMALEHEALELDGDWDPVWQTRFNDGCDVHLHRAPDGRHRFAYGDRAVFELSEACTTLACRPARADEPSWQRFLLDTVLHCTSLLSGFEALHASAVATPEGAIAFLGVTGGGKSSLAAELVARGYPLFCDDILAIQRTNGTVLAHPGPPLMNVPVEASMASELGAVVAHFEGEGEDWVAVSVGADTPLPLAGVYLLERRPTMPTRATRTVAGPLDLLPHALCLRYPPERMRQRFQLLADVACDVPVWQLQGEPGSTPGELADAVERSLAGMVVTA